MSQLPLIPHKKHFLSQVRLRQLEGHRQPCGDQDPGASQRRVHPPVHLRSGGEAHLEGGATRLRGRPHSGRRSRPAFADLDQQVASHQRFVARSCFGIFLFNLLISNLS